MANDTELKPWQQEQEDLDIPGSEEDETTATSSPPSTGEQVGPLPFPSAPPGSVPVGTGSYLPPLSPNARMVIGQEIPQSQWLREPVRTQIPWSVLEYDRRKKEMESQERMDALVRSLARTPMASASKAIEMATQMEGRLAFDADVKAGVPISEALMKHATKMYAGSPSAQLGAFKMAQPQAPFVPQAPTQVAPGLMRVQRGPNAYAYMPAPGPTGEQEAILIKDPRTGQVVARQAPGTREVSWIKPPSTASLKLRAEIANLNSYMNELSRANELGIAQDQDYMQTLRRKIKQGRDNIERLSEESEQETESPQQVQPTKSKVVKIKDKRTGRTGNYSGDINLLPKDRYEIVG